MGALAALLLAYPYVLSCARCCYVKRAMVVGSSERALQSEARMSQAMAVDVSDSCRSSTTLQTWTLATDNGKHTTAPVTH
jgi:hypothetical protein